MHVDCGIFTQFPVEISGKSIWYFRVNLATKLCCVINAARCRRNTITYSPRCAGCNHSSTHKSLPLLFFSYVCLCTQWLISPVGWDGMLYDCANDYTVYGPAGHYNKWLESESESVCPLPGKYTQHRQVTGWQRIKWNWIVSLA